MYKTYRNFKHRGSDKTVGITFYKGYYRIVQILYQIGDDIEVDTVDGSPVILKTSENFNNLHTYILRKGGELVSDLGQPKYTLPSNRFKYVDTTTGFETNFNANIPITYEGDDGDFYISSELVFRTETLHTDNQLELMQSTTLWDSGTNTICYHHILRHIENQGVGVVVFVDGCTYLRIKNDLVLLSSTNSQNYEIIGNIYTPGLYEL